jgi:hypothetical protein
MKEPGGFGFVSWWLLDFFFSSLEKNQRHGGKF